MKVLKVIISSIFIMILISKTCLAEVSFNLLTNPDAETGDLTGWTHTDNFYVTSSENQTSGTVTPHEGSYFFSLAKTNSTYEKASQDIDVSNFSDVIDAGNMNFKSGVWVQNEYLGAKPDSCKLSIQYLDSTGTMIGKDTSGEIAHSKNNYWEKQVIENIIPTNTKTIRFILEGFLHNGSQLNSFFDNAYLYLEKLNAPECIDSDNDGVADSWDNCSETPPNSWVDKNGCPATGLYSEEQMNQMVSAILLWGDINEDGKISLVEAIKALRITSGIKEPAIK